MEATCTIVKHNSLGSLTVIPDNADGVYGMRESKEFYFYDTYAWELFDDARPATFTAQLRQSPTDPTPLRATFFPAPPARPKGQHLLVIPPGGDEMGRQALVDAFVLEGERPHTAEEMEVARVRASLVANGALRIDDATSRLPDEPPLPARHRVQLVGCDVDGLLVKTPPGASLDAGAADALDASVVFIDLNEFNHCTQGFESVETYRLAIARHCDALMRTTRERHDGVAGRSYSTRGDLIDVRIRPMDSEDPTAERRKGVAGAWAEGEGAAAGRATELPAEGGALQAAPAERSVGGGGGGGEGSEESSSGVWAEEANRLYVGVETVRDLATPLLSRSSLRTKGGVESHAILLCAPAGGGKTCSLVQLCHELALRSRKACVSASDAPVPLVPVLVRASRLAALLHARPLPLPGASPQIADAHVIVEYFARESDLSNETSGRWLMMLSQALQLRSLVILLDGLDETPEGNCDRLCAFVRDSLAGEGHRVVCTSRIEGGVLPRFARPSFETRGRVASSAGFRLYTLERLDNTQQDAVAQPRLVDEQQDTKARLDHLTALSRVRLAHDELYERCLSEAQRRALERFSAPNRLVIAKTGLPDPSMRLKGPDGSAGARALSGLMEVRSKVLMELNGIFTGDALKRLDGMVEAGTAEDAMESAVRACLQRRGGSGGGVVVAAHHVQIGCNLVRLVRKRRNLLRTKFAAAARGAKMFAGAHTDVQAYDSPAAPKDAKQDQQVIKTSPSLLQTETSPQLAPVRRDAPNALPSPAPLAAPLVEAGQRTWEQRHREALRMYAPHTTAASLWPCIVKRCDQVFAGVEGLILPFGRVLRALATNAGLPADAVRVEPMLRDPVSVHDEAMDEYALLEFDEPESRTNPYSSRYLQGKLYGKYGYSYGAGVAFVKPTDPTVAEASTPNLLRASVTCPDGDTLLSLLALLRLGFRSLDGSRLLRISIVRCRNAFSAARSVRDPMRFRHVALTLLLEVGGRMALCELTVLHQAIAVLHEQWSAREHYAYFASTLLSSASRRFSATRPAAAAHRSPASARMEMDAELDRCLSFFGTALARPMPLSLYLGVLTARAERSSRGKLADEQGLGWPPLPSANFALHIEAIEACVRARIVRTEVSRPKLMQTVLLTGAGQTQDPKKRRDRSSHESRESRASREGSETEAVAAESTKGLRQAEELDAKREDSKSFIEGEHEMVQDDEKHEEEELWEEGLNDEEAGSDQDEEPPPDSPEAFDRRQRKRERERILKAKREEVELRRQQMAQKQAEEELVPKVMDMLSVLALSNMAQRRHEFTTRDVEAALCEAAELWKLFQQLSASPPLAAAKLPASPPDARRRSGSIPSGASRMASRDGSRKAASTRSSSGTLHGVPLLRSLTADDIWLSKAGQGLLQFEHMGLQHALAVRALVSRASSSLEHEGQPPIWSPATVVSDPFLRAMAVVGEGTLGGALAASTRGGAEWEFRFDKALDSEGARCLALLLRANRTLTRLSLELRGDGTSGGFLAIAASLESNTALRGLAIERSNLGAHGARALADALIVNESIEELSLAENGFGEDGGAALGRILTTNRTLRTLEVTYNALGGVGGAALAASLAKGGNATLTELSLKRNGLDSAAGVAFARALEHNRSLRSLSLRTNCVGDDGDSVARAFAQTLELNRCMTSLDLSDNCIGAAGCVAIAKGLRANQCLSDLNLASNQLGVDGAEALALALQINTSLVVLDVFDAALTSEGGEAIADALSRRCSLTSLSIRRNGLSAEAVQALRLCKAAKLVDLDVGEDVVEENSGSEDEEGALTSRRQRIGRMIAGSLMTASMPARSSTAPHPVLGSHHTARPPEDSPLPTRPDTTGRAAFSAAAPRLMV